MKFDQNLKDHNKAILNMKNLLSLLILSKKHLAVSKF